MANRIDFDVNFNVNKISLSNLTKSLDDVQKIVNTKAKGKTGLTEELKEAQSAATKLQNILNQSWNNNLGQIDLTKFQKGLNDNFGSAENLKRSLSGAGQTGINAFNNIARSSLNTNIQIKKTNETLEKFAISLKNTIRFGISSSIFNNITNAIQQAWSYSKNLDTSLNDIRIVTSKSADEMGRFARQANDVSKSLGAATLDYTKASLIYAQQGLEDEEIAARAATTVKAANVTGQSGSAVSEQLTAVWNGYNATAEETEGYVDKLAAVAASTAADLEELSVGMSKVAAAANSMGVDFDDLNAQIATIVSVTRQAPESVGTALKTIYARLGDLKVDGIDEFGVSLGEVSGKLEQMGIQVLDQEGNMRNMTDIMQDVAAKWNTWTEAQKQAAAVAMAGKRQYNNLIALFENWDTTYTNALNTSKNAYGTLQEQQDIYMESVEAHLQQLRTEAERTYDILFDTGAVNGFTSILTGLLDTFNDFIDGFGSGTNAILFLGTVFVRVFHNQIGKELNRVTTNFQGFVNQIKGLQAGKSLAEQYQEEALRQVTNERSANGRIELSEAGDAAVQKQAQIRERILKVAGALTEEERKQLQIQEQEIGNLTEQIALNKEIIEVADEEINKNKNKSKTERALERNGVTGGVDWEDTEKAVGQLGDAYSFLATEIEDTEKKVTGINKLHIQWQSSLKLVDDNYKNITRTATSLYEKGILTEKETNTILKNIELLQNPLSSEEQKAVAIQKINEIISKEYKDQNGALQQQKNSLDIINNTLTQEQEKLRAMRENEILGNQSVSLEAGIDNALREAERSKRFGDIANGIAAVGSAASSAAGILMTFGDAASTGEERVNSLFSGLTGISSSLMLINPLWGMAITGLVQLGKAIFDATGLSEKFALTLSSTEEKISKMKESMAEAAESAKSFRGAKESLEEVSEEYEKLSKKAGDYDKNIDDLTEAERSRYNELKDLVLQYNDEALIGYNDRGEAILAENQGIQETIDLLKEKYEQEKKENYEKNKKNNFKAVTAELEDIRSQQEVLQNQSGNEIFSNELTNAIQYLRENYNSTKNSELFDKLTQLTTGNIEEIEKNKDEIDATLSEITNTINKSDREFWNKELDHFSDLQDALSGRVNDLKATELEISSLEKIDSSFFLNALKLDDSSEANYDKLVELGKEQKIESIDAYITGFYSDKTYANTGNAEKDAQQAFDIGNIFIQDFADVLEQNEGLIPEIQAKAEELGKKYANSNYTEFLAAIEETKAEFQSAHPNISDDIWSGIFGANLDTSEITNKINDITKTIKEQIGDENLNSNITDFFGPNTIEYADQVIAKLSEMDLTTDNWNIKLQETIDYFEKIGDGVKAASANTNAASLADSIRAGDVDASNINENENYGKLIDTLDTLKEKFPELRQEFAILTQEEMAGTQAFILALEQVQDKLFGIQINGLVSEVEDMKESLATIDIEANPEEFFDVLDDILEKEYSIDVAIHTEAEQEFNAVTTAMENMESAAAKIGDDYKVAADDLRELSNAFPGVLEGMQILSDGTVQLNQDMVQSAMEAATAEAGTAADSAVARIQSEIDVLKTKRASYVAIAEAAEVAATQIDNGESVSADLRATIDSNLETIKTANSKLAADGQMKNQEEVTDNHKQNSNIVAQNSAGAANAWSRAYFEASKEIIANAKKAHDAIDGVSFEAASHNPIKPNFQAQSAVGGNATEVTGFKESLDYSDSKSMNQAAAQARAAVQAIDAQIADMEGMSAELQGRAANIGKEFGNIATGKGSDGKKESGGGKGGGSGKEITPKELKEWKDEFDRYYDYNNLIEKTEQSLEDLNREKEKAGRLELVKVLDQENKLLQKQIQNYELLANAQRAEASELQGILKGYGAEFNEAGELTNYAQITADALDVYNNAVLQYNAGQISDDSLKTYETNLETFKKALDRYDTLIYKEMIENSEKIKDANDKILENNFQGWEIQIEVKLEKTQLERDLRDVRKILKKNFGAAYEDVTVIMQDTMDDFFSHLSDRATLEDAMADLRKEIDIMVAGGTSDIFGTDLEKAKDKYKELAGQYKETIEDAENVYDDAWDKYITGIEHAKERFDQLNEDIDYHVEMLEFAKELSELLYTGDSPFADMNMYYKNMDAYYTNAKEANLTNLELAKTQRDMYEKLWRDSGATRENMDQWTEDQKLYYQYWQESQTELNNLTLEGAKLLKDEYLYEMQKTMDELESSLTNGLGFDEIKRQWDLIKKKSDEYFDDVEKVYEVESLANKFDAEISKTTGLKNQQKLKKVRDELIDQLREIDDLTEYDLQMAEARYDLELKQIALEDARNNKNSVKLVRNDQGNWSYQYVSDMDEIETKQQEMLDAWYKLYELPSEAYQKNLETRMQLDQEFYQQLDKINKDEKLSAEDKEKRKQELAEWYYSEVDRLADQNAKYQKDLSIATSGVLITAYNNDRDAYEGMTDEERALVDSLSQHKIDSYDAVRAAIEDDYDSIGTKTEETLKTSREDWRNSANSIIDLWQNNSTGIRAKVEEAFFNMGKARLNFQNDLEELQKKADVNFRDIAGYMNAVGDIISGGKDSLATKISQLRELGQAEIALLNQSVLSLRDHWGLVKTAIEDNLRLIDEYMQKQKQVNEAPASTPNIPSSPAVAQNVQTTAPSSSPSGNTGGNLGGSTTTTGVVSQSSQKPTMKAAGFKLVGTDLRLLSNSQGSYEGTYELRNTQGARIKQITAQGKTLVDRNNAASVAINKWFDGLSASNTFKVNYSGTGFKTGGYTGSWNDDSGRWTMLHQKELVLNKEDTANFLSGVKMIRDMSVTNGSINKAIMQSVANMMGSIVGINTGIIGNKTNTNNESNQIFNITAEFPNANDVNEIREAILSLPNLANQFIMSRGEMD